MKIISLFLIISVVAATFLLTPPQKKVAPTEGWECGMALCLCEHHDHGTPSPSIYDLHAQSISKDQALFFAKKDAVHTRLELSGKSLSWIYGAETQVHPRFTSASFYFDPANVHPPLMDHRLLKPPQISL